MNNDATEEPSAERDNALAIAKLEGELCGELKAIRAENEAMESRIEARLTEELGRLREDAAKRDKETAQRETRLILAVAAMIALAVTILGLLIGWPTA